MCGSCLEQTTWLRRNLAVKEQDEDLTSDASIATTSNGSTSEVFVSSSYSVQAQLVIVNFIIFHKILNCMFPFRYYRKFWRQY